MAPGLGITSAGLGGNAAGGQCSTSTASMSGTSMATPQASGSAALARQYLRSGFYPTGAPNEPASAPFVPSGILLKALLIAGAKSMEGGTVTATGATMGPPPDGYQGWGRLSLAGSLPLRGVTDPRVSLQLADGGQFKPRGQDVVLEGLVATGTGPVVVVLAWYDYPADENAAAALVNDLDLVVTLAGGGRGRNRTAAVTVYGNNPDTGAASLRASATTARHEPPFNSPPALSRPARPASPALPGTPDRVNTVECVRLRAPPAGSPITVRVRAFRMASGLIGGADARLPQRFAVAAVGHLTGSWASPLNPAFLQGPPPPAAGPP
ncbi:Serine protease/ABC transporter B family protein tagD, partial [Tetrabaena socialis]